MRSAITLLTLIGAAMDPLVAQTIQGVWKPVQVVIDSGADAGRHTTDVQPGLLIFTKGHYSILYVQGFKPRAVPSDSASDQELGLSFVPFTANAGTYQRNDSTITFSPSVAKHPAVMSGEPFTRQVRVKGDTLWVTAPGGKTTWVRIER
jgi:hypothetical protein